jgi:hypothetical protein
LAQSACGIKSQRKYTLDLLQDTRLLGSKPVDTSMDRNKQLAVDQGEFFDDPGLHGKVKLSYYYSTRYLLCS